MYYICAVHYEEKDGYRQIEKVKITYKLDSPESVSTEKTKQVVISDIESGTEVKTKYYRNDKWNEGDKVIVVTESFGYKYIRTDGSSKKCDNLENLPEY